MPLAYPDDYEVPLRPSSASSSVEWPGESRFESKSGRPYTSGQNTSRVHPSIKAAEARRKLIQVMYSGDRLNPFLSHQKRLRDTLRDLTPSKKKTEINPDDITLINAVKANYRFIYRINDGDGTVNTILQEVCRERGWREFKDVHVKRQHHNISSYERAMRGATGWNLWWSYSVYQFSPYKYLRPWQFTNHNPKGFQFCNKLYLTQYLRKMKVVHGAIYDFYPMSYIIPEDYVRLSMEHSKRATESPTKLSHTNLLDADAAPIEAPASAFQTVFISQGLKRPLWTRAPPPPLPSQIRFTPVWISKPVSQSQGKGIFLVTQLMHLPCEKKSVIQEYISRPFLIGGYKWDMRIYVCVAAIDPLVIYIYNEGLCRFCTEKYRTSDLTEMYSHLTNASLNKFAPNYQQDKDLIGPGCKWPLRKLRQHFRDLGIPDWLLWQKIMALVVLTVLGDSLRLGYSASNRNCFDLFGFDVIIDEEMKPWLLECNYSPGLGGDSETDHIVKRPMIHQLFDLLGFPDCSSYSNSRPGTPSRKKGKAAHDADASDETIFPLNSFRKSSGDKDSQDRLTRQYFEMLMEKMKAAHESEELVQTKRPKTPYGVCKIENSPEARLHDARSIYSQNLVVQYLKNQSQGRISPKVRDQLIKVATKKLKNKLQAAGMPSNFIDLEEDEDRPCLKTKTGSPKSSNSKEDLQNNLEVDKKKSNPDSEVSSLAGKDDNGNQRKPVPLKRAKSAPDRCLEALKDESSASRESILPEGFPIPSSEAFQKLKHYFDAGVDYPLDLKTGRFKECPALITVKKDWFCPVKQQGGWIRVYPFDMRTTKSPYKSSLTDLRQAVRSIEAYLKSAEQMVLLHPQETDDFYKRKIKQLCKRDTEVWIPPLAENTPTPGISNCNSSTVATCLGPSSNSSTIIITEPSPQCPFSVDINTSDE